MGKHLTHEQKAPLLVAQYADIITRLILGDEKLQVSHDYGVSEFDKSDLKRAIRMYNHYYDICGESSGFPDTGTLINRCLEPRRVSVQLAEYEMRQAAAKQGSAMSRNAEVS